MKLGDVLCAWCPNDEEQEEQQSHGICEEHAEEVLLKYYQQKFEQVPSYVERFTEHERTK